MGAQTQPPQTPKCKQSIRRALSLFPWQTLAFTREGGYNASMALTDDYGPITPYLASPDVSEVMVNGPNRIFIEQAGKITQIDKKFASEGELLRIMNLNQYSNAAAQPGLAVDKIKCLRLPVPPPSEQRRIATYLHRCCTAIDAAIGIKRRQTEVLRALRHSRVHRALTLGLDDKAVAAEIPLETDGATAKGQGAQTARGSEASKTLSLAGHSSGVVEFPLTFVEAGTAR